MTVAYSVCNSAPTTLVAATAKTAIMAIAHANSGLLLVSFDISFDGVAAAGVPALVEIVNSTQAGAGTSATAPTIAQTRGRVTGGAPPTAGGNYSAEPTVLVALKRMYIPVFNGIYSYQFPLGREFETDDSGGAIKAIGIRVTAPANVNCLASLEVESNG